MGNAYSHDIHLQQVSVIHNARTASDHQQNEKKYGVRYSDLLRLPYFDIVEYHVIDPMHNLLLGTSKYLMTMWKDDGILIKTQFEYIQEEVDAMKVPVGVGRIPHKISSNWICIIYSTLCLKEPLPVEHYECWMLFQEACRSLLQPSLSSLQLSIADNKLYGKEKCTPNMHMHMHLSKSIQNYGPVTAFWCFPFERFNGILGTFQKNWISPEQMAKKFISYQDLLLIDISSALPQELREFFEHHVSKCKDVSLGEGSLMQTHVDSIDLLEYKKSSFCIPSQINSIEGPMHMLYRRYEGLFDPEEVESLTSVYKALILVLNFHIHPWYMKGFTSFECSTKLLFHQSLKDIIPQLYVLIGLGLVGV